MDRVIYINFIYKIKRWGEHHRIESFGIIVGCLVFFLLLDCMAISIHTKHQNDDILVKKAIYVSRFTTSLSGKEGNISQVYTNPERTKCVILMHFDSTENLVTNAKSYNVFIRGYDIQKGRYALTTKSNPVGGYYVFGTTGYSAIYLSDANGFPAQCLECVVRCNEVLKTDAVLEDEEAAERDVTYAEYDQWRVIINPRGESAKVCDFLDDFDIVSLYQDAVIDETETEMRAKLESDVSNLQVYLNKMNTYRDNLKNLGVKVPEYPEYIVGDEFMTGEDGEMVYKPNYIFNGGVDFDWFHSTLHDTSFIDLVKEPSMSDAQFFNSLQDYSAQEEKKEQVWYMVDGTRVDTSSTAASKLVNIQSVRQNISDYEGAVNSYYSLKKQYQCTDLIDYMVIESNMRSAGKYFTSNYGEGAVIVW